MIIGVDSASSEEKVLSIAVNGAFLRKSTIDDCRRCLSGVFHSRISRRFFSICFFKVSTEADEQNPSRGVFMQ